MGGMSDEITAAAIVVFLLLCTTAIVQVALSSSPEPKEWPHQFHSILMMNYSNELQIIDLWYDWTNGRNLNIIQKQLDDNILYDLEWNNGTSFYYTLPNNFSPSCTSAQLDVGILRPNWLDGAKYLGQRHMNGFLCNVWEKVDFIWYYEDLLTRRPVHWLFYTGRGAHVMTFEVGAVLEDEKWQAPAYCFGTKDHIAELLADNTTKASF
ncbi:uncharacterized protein At4g14100-like [Apium graveolens]|uniref:uncharacterized protein At4g14100-like n=1 Tax=Apium graveolens TaxID=4045 RepID=UPI003D7A5AB0